MNMVEEKDVTELFEALRGNATLMYGNPGVGKSYLCARLGRYATMKFKDRKPIFIWTDSNLLGTDWGKKLKELSGAQVYEMRRIISKAFYSAFNTVRNTGSMIVLDSVSGFEEYFYDPDKIGSPRVTLQMSRTARWISREFAIIAHDLKIPAIIIGHSTVEFSSGSEVPAFTRRAMKNLDMVVKVTREGNVIVAKVEMDRLAKHTNREFKIPIKFDFREAEVNVTEGI